MVREDAAIMNALPAAVKRIISAVLVMEQEVLTQDFVRIIAQAEPFIRITSVIPVTLVVLHALVSKLERYSISIETSVFAN